MAWQQVYETKLYNLDDDNSVLNVRISATPDSVNVITDVRKYIGDRGTLVGVGLFPDELRWMLQMAKTKQNSEQQFPFRKVAVIFENNIMNIQVIKRNGADQNMYLNETQLEGIINIQGEIEAAINEALGLLIK